MQKKKNCMIRVNAEILTQAKAQGFNISKVCENALKQKLTPNQPQIFDETFSKKVSMVGRTGFEPATFCTSSRCPNQTRRPALQPF
jgi:post-segregation antitoxin (ccd killing protein)